MAKRPRGTGSIFRREGSRCWFIQYFHNGRRRESSGSEDRKVAEGLLRKRLGEIATGAHLGLAAEKVTLGQLVDLVLADYEFRGRRSAKSVAWKAGAHFDEKFRAQSAAKWTTGDAQRYITNRRAEGAENATINRETAILRYGYTLAMRADPPLVHRAPYIPILEEDNVRQGFIDTEQYEKVLTALPTRLKALFVIAYHVGCRKGELLQIQWEQIDWDAKLIRLEKGQTKGKRPRTLPIYGDMDLWLWRSKEEAAPNCPWVFHYRGRQVGAHLKGWTEACDRAGVPGLLFHDLRRSAVRNMQRAGISRHVAMSISGHRTEAVFKRYDIIDEKDLGNAGEKMEAFFEKRKQERAAKLRRVK